MDELAGTNRPDDGRRPGEGAPQGSLSRRAMLKGAAGTAGVMTLAACTSIIDGDGGEGAGGGGSGSGAGSGSGGGASPAPTATGLPVDPATAVETWNDPWTWRPSEFPGDALQLNVIEHESPSQVVGFGNEGPSIFGYNGSIPGPTIRMRGDETYDLRLLNHLGLNAGSAPVGPAPDAAAFPPDITNRAEIEAQVISLPDWCLGEHSNGVHTIHTTNMHTHGLHVRPGFNPPDPETDEATVSDDIFTRLEPIEDLRMRQADPGVCGNEPLEGEVGPSASYQFVLGDVQGMPDQPHPPGTHWYHPHAHGSTHNQVTSGLAGFLVVEGDVDEAINETLTGQVAPDPYLATGPHDYRERMMLIQRVDPGNVSHDPDAVAKRLQTTVALTNGGSTPQTIVMRPNAIERWRILNGSVDGKGYLRFMVLEGQWVHEVPPGAVADPTTLEDFTSSAAQLLRVEDDGTRVIPTTDEIEAAKVPLWQLAVDGVTLVDTSGAEPQYRMRDLDFDAPPNPLRQDFTNLGACYADAESLQTCYDRPNEFYMAPANRTDMMFQAPADADGRVYTVVAKASAIHTDNLQRAIELLEFNLAYARTQAETTGRPLAEIVKKLGLGLTFPADTIMAYVVGRVPENGSAAPSFDLGDLSDALARTVPVPPYLIPPSPADLEITAAERRARPDLGRGRYRSRTVRYSGWGAATWPKLLPQDLQPNGPGPVGDINPVYLATTANSDETLVMPPIYRTMAVDGRKFNPDDPGTPRMLLDTAEQWAAFNNSVAVWGAYSSDVEIDFSLDAKSDELKAQRSRRNYQLAHTVGWPVTRNEAADRGWSITTRAIDHPFHIHTNPMWLMRIDVPDADGNLVNVLPAPRWHDVAWMPRSGGGIAFRSRFPDFTGRLVNHCHILLHEDNGMMQMVEIVDDDAESNFEAVDEVATFDSSGPYEPDSLEQAYRECTRFIDNNRSPDRFQEYPAENGVFEPPPLPG